jgi:hypothetical protein
MALAVTRPARAQDDTSRGRAPSELQGSALTWQIEPIINLYIKNMVRHYDLTKEQEDYTRALMTRRVKRFLTEYEKDSRSLFQEYLYYQRQRELPSPEAARDFARRGGPLAAAMRKEIIDGNMEWRRILNDEQKAKHDKDLDAMNRQFDMLEKQLDRWSRGDVQSSDLWGRSDVGPRPWSPGNPEDAWKHRVNSFIQEYNLGEEQQQTALSILRELEGEAARYREKHKDRLEQLDARYRELARGGTAESADEKRQAREDMKELVKERSDLEAPIRNDLYEQLMTRLNRIPTELQRRQRELHLEKLQARVANARANRAGTTRPAVTETRPATTEPASEEEKVATRPE